MDQRSILALFSRCWNTHNLTTAYHLSYYHPGPICHPLSPGLLQYHPWMVSTLLPWLPAVVKFQRGSQNDSLKTKVKLYYPSAQNLEWIHVSLRVTARVLNKALTTRLFTPISANVLIVASFLTMCQWPLWLPIFQSFMPHEVFTCSLLLELSHSTCVHSCLTFLGSLLQCYIFGKTFPAHPIWNWKPHSPRTSYPNSSCFIELTLHETEYKKTVVV